MKVLLRNAAAGRYYSGDNNWTSDKNNAMDLKGVERAIRLNSQYNIGATDVILAYEHPPCTLAIPIAPAAYASSFAPEPLPLP